MQIRRRRRRFDADAGILPLINVVFLLLIFFMLAGRLTEAEETTRQRLARDLHDRIVRELDHQVAHRHAVVRHRGSGLRSHTRHLPGTDPDLYADGGNGRHPVYCGHGYD